jgi:hypothetical protein
MKSYLTRAVLTVAGALLLGACDGSGSLDAPAFTPTAESFTDFVVNQFGVDPATAEPVEINNRDFTFLDNNNPNAFNTQLN